MKSTKICTYCKHFYNHYMRSRHNGEYYKLPTGHCIYPWVRSRKVNQSCRHFEEKREEERGDVSGVRPETGPAL